MLRGKLRRDAIHQRQRIEIGVHVEEIDIRHHGRAIGQRIDQAFAGKTHQRFTNGRARHAKAFGQLHLVHRAAGGQNQIENLVAQDVIDHLHAGAALAFIHRGLFRLGHAIVLMCRHGKYGQAAGNAIACAAVQPGCTRLSLPQVVKVVHRAVTGANGKLPGLGNSASEPCLGAGNGHFDA